MIAIFCFLGLIVSGYTSPVSVTADEREAFAQKLLNCVKEKRSRYSQATITYSGYVPKYSKYLIISKIQHHMHIFFPAYTKRSLLYCRDAVLNESVNDCLKEAIEDLRPYMSTGIPSLDLKPTDPLTIDNIDLNRDIPPFTIRTKLDNVRLILVI